MPLFPLNVQYPDKELKGRCGMYCMQVGEKAAEKWPVFWLQTLYLYRLLPLLRLLINKNIYLLWKIEIQK